MPEGAARVREARAAGVRLLDRRRGGGHRPLGRRAVAHARVGITGVGDVAYRATAVEEALVGRRLLAQRSPCGRRPR